MQSPYSKGKSLALKIHRLKARGLIPQLDDHTEELQAEILDVIEPSTMSVVLQVGLKQHGPSAPIHRMILKVFDRQFSPQLREFKDTGLATSASEARFCDFVHSGSMPRFIAEYEENGPWGPWAHGEWNVVKREAYFYAKSTQSHEVELEIYDRLVEMQGIHVPTIFADVRLAPQHATTQEDESLAQYTQIRAILMEYIPGFPLNDIVTEVPETDWALICDQAIDIIGRISDNDFINFDIKTRNILVRRNEEAKGSYQVFYLDFGECGFRDPSDSDEIWRERKRQKNEEGAVGYIMMNHISYAKGKKGKKYKGPLALPWEYKPSLRFEGEYIELCKNAS